MKVSLPHRLQRFVEAQVEQGRYADATDLVRHAVRRLAEDEVVRAAVRSAADRDVVDSANGILMRAVAGMDEDLRMVLAEVRAMTAAKERMRELLRRVGRDVSCNLAPRRTEGPLAFDPEGLGGESAYHRVPIPVPDPWSEGDVGYIVTDLHRDPIERVDQLTQVQDELRGKLDGMNEMSEMTSLRIQMMMDRRSKFISTLSNVIKKFGDTQGVIVQNLK